ncbi:MULTISPECIES: hypothetical protein [Eikenella]|uniref:hypothetical protein n=1 Tax=Eikenella sp. Marseille-P7795 TaxID=2866577 RepID=UPI0012E7B2D6|nr:MULTISPECIES: hypothetical protein [Eikenella]
MARAAWDSSFAAVFVVAVFQMGAAEVLDELGGFLVRFAGRDDLVLHRLFIHGIVNRIGGEQAAEGVFLNPTLCIFFAKKQADTFWLPLP